jgi:hypothetical protein
MKVLQSERRHNRWQGTDFVFAARLDARPGPGDAKEQGFGVTGNYKTRSEDIQTQPLSTIHPSTLGETAHVSF